MNTIEKNLVKFVAKLAPWFAPVPSAFFVARSALVHLSLPLLVAIVVAAIIETLGLSTVHTALWAYDWNMHKRKTDPTAPVLLAIALGGVYVVATLGLVVFLEVWPFLATYAPALFPALAVVGAVNLALISRQEQREADVESQKAEQRAQRQASRSVQKDVQADVQQRAQDAQIDVQNAVLDSVNRARRQRKADILDAMVDIYVDSPEAGPTEIARRLGIGRSTVYNYLSDLETAGRIARNNGDGVAVLGRR
jgi:predicted transcriptional regulator